MDGGIKGAKVKWEICHLYLTYSILKDLHEIASAKFAFLPAQRHDDPKDLGWKYLRCLDRNLIKGECPLQTWFSLVTQPIMGLNV